MIEDDHTFIFQDCKFVLTAIKIYDNVSRKTKHAPVALPLKRSSIPSKHYCSKLTKKKNSIFYYCLVPKAFIVQHYLICRRSSSASDERWKPASSTTDVSRMFKKIHWSLFEKPTPRTIEIKTRNARYDWYLVPYTWYY